MKILKHHLLESEIEKKTTLGNPKHILGGVPEGILRKETSSGRKILN